MTMTSVTGHLMELDFGDGHRKWGSCARSSASTRPSSWACPTRRRTSRRSCSRRWRVRRAHPLARLRPRGRGHRLRGDRRLHQAATRGCACGARASRRSSRATSTARWPTLVQPDAEQSDAVLARSEIDLRLGAAFTRCRRRRCRTASRASRPRGSRTGRASSRRCGSSRSAPSASPPSWPRTFWKIELAHEATDEEGEEPRRCAFAGRAAASSTASPRSCSTRRACAAASRDRGLGRRAARRASGGRRRSRRSSCRRRRAASCGSRRTRRWRSPSKLYQEGYLSYPRTETDRSRRASTSAA